MDLPYVMIMQVKLRSQDKQDRTVQQLQADETAFFAAKKYTCPTGTISLVSKLTGLLEAKLTASLHGIGEEVRPVPSSMPCLSADMRNT